MTLPDPVSLSRESSLPCERCGGTGKQRYRTIGFGTRACECVLMLDLTTKEEE